MKQYELTNQDYELIDRAKEIIETNFDTKTYIYTVGSAIRSKSGEVFTGINCDGIHGSCAEFISMGAARAAGVREFDTIVAVYKNAPNCLLPPCGNCRQMLLEYSPHIKVILNNESQKMIKVEIQDLLPLAYVHNDQME
ncbi:cytidine deaminase [Paenibacillus daejeonensis]|uniref:cytidine deaminase n=1 Tax=Paenibacillus daejeonensis TaxID=135193 RepID=UPI00035FACA1|nr:cytidine deaminase [Paenibacillus daejeonensis]